MSLPSYAQFFDKDMKVLGDCFVNCGWFVQTPGIIRCLRDNVTCSEEYKNPEVVFIELYGMSLKKQMLEDCRGHSRETVEKLFDHILKEHRKTGII